MYVFRFRFVIGIIVKYQSKGMIRILEWSNAVNLIIMGPKGSMKCLNRPAVLVSRLQYNTYDYIF